MTTTHENDFDRFSRELDQAPSMNDKLRVVTPLGKTLGDLTAEDLAELEGLAKARARQLQAEAELYEARARQLQAEEN
jgi:hypothetical protein